jgi:hypothetical protein
MEPFSITKKFAFVAAVVGGAIAAFGGDAVIFFGALLGVISLFVLLAETFWTLHYTSRLGIKLRSSICVAMFFIFCTIFVVPLKNLYYKSDEDLRVSFRSGAEKPSELTINYLFSNLGKQAALVNSVGLFEIVSTDKMSNPPRNYELCDSNFETTLMVLQTGFMGRGAQVGGDSQRSSIYFPKESTIDGMPWLAKEPISIDSGKNKIVTSIFELEPNHTTKYNIIVMCPLIVTLNTAARGRTSICRGFLQTLTGANFISTKSNEQFKILPHYSGTRCELTGGR